MVLIMRMIYTESNIHLSVIYSGLQVLWQTEQDFVFRAAKSPLRRIWLTDCTKLTFYYFKPWSDWWNPLNQSVTEKPLIYIRKTFVTLLYIADFTDELIWKYFFTFQSNAPRARVNSARRDWDRAHAKCWRHFILHPISVDHNSNQALSRIAHVRVHQTKNYWPFKTTVLV